MAPITTCTSRDMCRCRHSLRGRGDPPTEALADDGPAYRASGAADGAVSRHRRGARGGGERRGRGRDGRRARRGGAGDGAGGSCGCHAARRTERCDPGRDRACDRDATRPGPSQARYHAGFVRYRGWYRHNGGSGGDPAPRRRCKPRRPTSTSASGSGARATTGRHAGECRGGRRDGTERHRSGTSALPIATRPLRARRPARRPRRSDAARCRFFFERAGRSGTCATWQWNCLSNPDLSVIPLAGSTTGSVPKNWTWIWNCGRIRLQYQNATAAQYQPSNANIAICISSPGGL